MKILFKTAKSLRIAFVLLFNSTQSLHIAWCDRNNAWTYDKKQGNYMKKRRVYVNKAMI